MSGYSDFLNHLGIDKKQMIASMWSKIPESEKPSKRGQEMTKEELKKEVEEKAKKRTKGFKCQYNCEKSYVMGALDFAEPRERRIEELEKTCQDLSDKFDYQVKQVMELEQQNAKLKDDLCRVTSDRDGYRTVMLSYEHKIKDLENKVAELKKQLALSEHDREHNDYELVEVYKKGSKLEKENAELKKQQFSLRNERNTFFVQNEQYEKDLIDFNENLTKAKEIIKKMLYEYQRLCLIKKETLTEAEQFLNSEVEK